MSKKKKIGLIVFFTVLILLLIVAIIQNVSSKEEGEGTYKTAVVENQEPIIADGKVMPAKTQEYTYDPQKGEVASISVEDGQSVEAGQELFHYKNEAIENQLADTKTSRTRLYNQLEKNKEQLKKSKKQLDQAKKAEANRIDAANSLPEITTESKDNPLDTSNMEVLENQNSVQALEDTILNLKNQISDVEIQINRLQDQASTVIIANVDGRILLDESLQNNATMPFLRIISDDTLIQSSVSEYDYYALSEELVVGIYVNAEDREVKGIITDIAETSQTATGEVNMGISPISEGNSGVSDMSNFQFFVKPQDEIHYDFTVQIKIPLEDIVIPESAILKENDQEFVFVVKDRKAQKQTIQRKKRGLQNVVKEGLQLKDVIVTNPDQELKDGMDILASVEGESASQ